MRWLLLVLVLLLGLGVVWMQCQGVFSAPEPAAAAAARPADGKRKPVAGVYCWTDAEGHVQYGDHPPSANARQLDLGGKGSTSSIIRSDGASPAK